MKDFYLNNRILLFLLILFRVIESLSSIHMMKAIQKISSLVFLR